MQNYSRTIKIFSIIMLVFGVIRAVIIVPSLSNYETLRVLGKGIYLSAITCDLLTSLGSVVFGVVALVAVIKKKALLPIGVVGIVICIAFFISFMAVTFLGNVRLNRGGTALICALPVLVGVNLIQMHRAEQKAASAL